MVISHTFARSFLWKRWKLLTEKYDDIEVMLIAPETWVDGDKSNYTFGKKMSSAGESYESERFHVHVVDMVTKGSIGWISKGLIREIKQFKPDYLYHIGTHLQDSLFEAILVKKIVSRKTKVLVFSMRGPQHLITRLKDGNWRSSLNYYYRKLKLRVVRKNTAAVFCHYPKAKELFLEEGFKEPIYIQTQVGVDTEVFKPDPVARKEIRAKYKLEDCFVFGCAIRLGADKGIYEMLEALPSEGNFKFLVMGSGNDEEVEKVKKIINDRRITDRVILAGFIDNQEMNKYWNAVDCAIHVPRTTEKWVETFSLALVQAMSTQICVIGNDSGSVPYQIGDEGIIVHEGDVVGLRNAMLQVMNDDVYRELIAQKMRERAVECFDIRHLTKCFYSILQDLNNNEINMDHFDMANMKWKG